MNSLESISIALVGEWNTKDNYAKLDYERTAGA